MQVKRFTNDVLRILKSQACKQISLNEFPSTYAKIFGRNFDITDYGMCNMLDALSELPEGNDFLSIQNKSFRTTMRLKWTF